MCADGRWSAEATGQMTASPAVGREAWWWRQQAGEALKRKDTTRLCKRADCWQMKSPTVTGRRSWLLLLRMLWFSFLQHAAAHSRPDLVTDVSSHATCIVSILSQGCTLINPWQKEQHITPRMASACGSIADKITCLCRVLSSKIYTWPMFKSEKTQTATQIQMVFIVARLKNQKSIHCLKFHPIKYLDSFHIHNIDSGNTNPENT